MPDIESAPSDADVIASLSSFIRAFGGGGEELVSVVVQSRCASCDGSTFWMQCSEEEGVANRTCTECKRAVFIGDSDEHWDAADVGDATCPCGKKVFHIGVGYCLTDAGEVAWMIVGAACLACSSEGVYADWSIDYEPSKQLLDMA